MAHRNDRAYVAKREALKRQCKKTGAPCHLCGHPFDFTLDWSHAMAFTADHIEAIANGGSMTGALLPAHRSCNARRGKKPIEETKHLPPPRTTREW